MSDIDDEVKETKATKFQRILDKLELIEKAVNKLNEDKPKPVKNYWIKIVMLTRIREACLLIN